jgi:hypothetical protein
LGWKEVIDVKPSTSLIGLAIVAFVGALLVPVALGVTRPDDKAGRLGVGAAVVATQAAHPNDVAGPLGAGRIALETQNRYWGGERDQWFAPAGDVAIPAVVPLAVSEPSGRDWGAITAAVAAVALVALLAVGIAMRIEHRGPFKPVPH